MKEGAKPRDIEDWHIGKTFGVFSPRHYSKFLIIGSSGRSPFHTQMHVKVFSTA